MIEFKNLTKTYRLENGNRKAIFENISFAFPEGKNIALLGRNGVGKSTTFRLIAGSDLPDSGRVIRSKRISWPLGFGGAFHPSLTGEENLRFASRIYGADLKAVRSYVDEFAELGEYLYQPLKTYSSGMRARLAFGLSLAIQFDVYLIDEITGVGDPQFRKKSKEAIANLKRNAYIIMTSHNMPTLREYCDIALVLENGCIHVYENLEDGISVYQGESDASTKADIASPEKAAEKDSKEFIRNLQMHYIKKKSKVFNDKGAPVILVETKRKKSDTGTKINEQGYVFDKTDKINIFDFLEKEQDKNSPSGIYDLARAKGWACAGVYLGGAQLAANAIRKWWYDTEMNGYSDANRVYVIYLNAGRNVLNNKAIKLWNAELQKLADDLNITVHVSFVPPGPRSWKLISNRVFNFNVKGDEKRYINEAAVVSLIGAQETSDDIKVKAVLDSVEDKQDAELSFNINMHVDEFYGKWNYRIYPNI
ncbi:MAG: ISAzo13-like element transposase-related protein [Gammaproteobacteria bacterium]